jgi:UDPglucose--hexose-1-phosphate uridylyltransferase
MSSDANIVHTGKRIYRFGKRRLYQPCQIFENKGSVMGCSNPHPHGQIWAQSSLPTEVEKTQNNLKAYFDKHNKTLLQDYVKEELKLDERIVLRMNILWWFLLGIWPYETMIVSKRNVNKITDFTEAEVADFAVILKQLTTKYDNLLTSFHIHQGFINRLQMESCIQMAFSYAFYPPLLRSATVKKFMVVTK